MQLEVSNLIKTPAESLKGVTGGGAFSTVFATEIPNVVVKRVDKMWDPTFLYYIWCMNQSKKKSWMPKLYGITVDYTEGKMGVAYVIMKKLLAMDEVSQRTPYTTSEAYDDDDIIEIKNLLESQDAIGEKKAVEIVDMILEVSAMIQATPMTEDELLFFDAHNDNWMWDDKTLILNDPFTVKGWTHINGNTSRESALVNASYVHATKSAAVNVIGEFKYD